MARSRLLRESLAALRRGVQFPRALQAALAMARLARGESTPPAALPLVGGALIAGGDGDVIGDEAFDNGAWTAEQDGILARYLHQGGWGRGPGSDESVEK